MIQIAFGACYDFMCFDGTVKPPAAPEEPEDGDDTVLDSRYSG